jgi:hypothetical protein
VIENIKEILKNVYTTITEIDTILEANNGKLNTDKLNDYKIKNAGYKAEAVELTDSVNKSDNTEASNKILEKCKTLDTEVTTFKTELESEISSLDTSGSGLDTGFGLSAATSIHRGTGATHRHGTSLLLRHTGGLRTGVR